jgi:hypothetical protein
MIYFTEENRFREKVRDFARRELSLGAKKGEIGRSITK